MYRDAVNTAQMLHETLLPLWPPLRPDSVAIIIDSCASIADDAVGYCLEPEGEDLATEKYLAGLSDGHEARWIFKHVPRPLHVIVLDHRALARGGWKDVVLVALHELAHAIRQDLAEGGAYPLPAQMLSISSFLEEQRASAFAAGNGSRALGIPVLEVSDQTFSDMEDALFVAGDRDRTVFGGWAVRTLQHDGVHDLLFYLILYLLERKAQSKRLFAKKAPIRRSAFVAEDPRATQLLGLGTEIELMSQRNVQIESVDDWRVFAPPKRKGAHWKAGHSALELAAAWFRSGQPLMPAEMDALLKSRPETRALIPRFAIAEATTTLDDCGGEPRNHDLLVVGQGESALALVAVEAKVNERFGADTVASYLRKCKPRSKVPRRISLLSRALFGREVDDQIGPLRYQLLTAAAGAVIEARRRGAARAIFVVHDLSGKAPEGTANWKDFLRFVRILANNPAAQVVPGILTEPLLVPGGPFVPSDVPLQLGWASVPLRARRR